MKKAIIRAIAMAIIATLIAVPSASAASTAQTAAAAEVLNPIELFPLTLTPKELLAVLKKHDIKIIHPGTPNNYIRVDEDGRRYEGAGRYFWYECEGITFTFFEHNEKMASIYVKNDNFATPEGIRVGDSRCKVFKTYGVWGKIIGFMIDHFSPFYKEGYDAKTKDGYYRFYYDGEKKLSSWAFYLDRTILGD